MNTCAIKKSSGSTLWLPKLKLLESDKEALLSPTGWLTDSIVKAVQSLIKSSFLTLKDFKIPVLDQCTSSTLCKENLFFIHQVIG